MESPAKRRRALRSKGDTSEVSAKGTLMLKHLSQIRVPHVKLMGGASSGPGGLTHVRCTNVWCPVSKCHVSCNSGSKGARAQATSGGGNVGTNIGTTVNRRRVVEQVPCKPVNSIGIRRGLRPNEASRNDTLVGPGPHRIA
ncbi:hypothetical protein TIFTF001_004422 [Ficus carica]|uniref:Uncharacterized protein n=1 Tax=Ficus carica TaxID=3494 RepID=A0AA87ZG40_FICCA|nr:hypothetical protein TIFTF001_004422 [Ficus carica]